MSDRERAVDLCSRARHIAGQTISSGRGPKGLQSSTLQQAAAITSLHGTMHRQSHGTLHIHLRLEVKVGDMLCLLRVHSADARFKFPRRPFSARMTRRIRDRRQDCQKLAERDLRPRPWSFCSISRRRLHPREAHCSSRTLQG